MGNRVYKSSSVNGNRKYIIDIAGELPTILLELDPNNSNMAIKKTYIYANSEVLAQYDSYTANTYFYLHDRLGSVRELINTDGGVVNSYTYNAFGESFPTECSETVSNPFKFTCQFFDDEISQYYLRARMYDPALMRFTGRDPESGKREEPLTLHKYLYCLNSPVDYIDPTGESADTAAAVGIGAGMYAEELVLGGVAFSYAYAMLINNELYQAMITSICIGVDNEVGAMVDFGLELYAATRATAARKDVAGNIKQFNIHLDKFRNSISPNDPLKHWLKEMKTFANNIRKAASRLRGNEQEETLKQVDEMMKTLEELAKEHNLPWG